MEVLRKDVKAKSRGRYDVEEVGRMGEGEGAKAGLSALIPALDGVI